MRLFYRQVGAECNQAKGIIVHDGCVPYSSLLISSTAITLPCFLLFMSQMYKSYSRDRVSDH